MKPYPRANASEGDGVALSAELYNRMVEDLERLDRLAVMPPLFLTGGASGATIGLRPTPGELVLVAIIGTETGGGRYQGSILYGISSGNTSNNFQLQGMPNQSATDGPAPSANDGVWINNALVCNLSEQFVNGSHILWADTADAIYVIGRVMGFTSESTPRTIVYINQTPIFPVIAKITGQYTGIDLAGVYYGRILQGQFCSGSNFGYQFPLSSINSELLGNYDNCWITNIWESTFGTQNTCSLPVGTFIWGVMVGYPSYSMLTSGNSSDENVWYQIYTWFPVQSKALTHVISNLTTSETANSTYGINEQSMLNNVKTDLVMLQAALSNLYQNLKIAGYSL